MGVILWLSDLHLDPYYGTELAASHKNGNNCSLPNNATLKEHPYGQVGCDAPPSLLEWTLQHASSKTNDIDFVLITGDFARHEMNNLFEDPSSNLQLFPTVISILSTCIQTIQDNLPNIPILPVIGNNDLVPDYFLEEEDSQDGEEAQEMLLSIANGLNQTFLDGNEYGQFQKGGYFARLVPLNQQQNSSILVLSLNTILYSTRHEPEYSPNNLDPYGQFHWLQRQLHQAAASKTTSDSTIVGVYLAGHIPPSIGSYRHSQLWHEEYIQAFSTILNDYTQGKYNPPEGEDSTPPPILGNFYGHVHTEEFRLFEYGLESKLGDASTTEALVVPVLVTSSITPIYGSNPSYRLVEFSDETGALLDYTTHYLDLDQTAANYSNNTNNAMDVDNNKLQEDPWIALPSFVQDYGLPDLSLESFQQLLQNFETELTLATQQINCGGSDSVATTNDRLWETFWKRQNLYTNAPDDGDDNDTQKSETTVMIDWLCTFGSSTTQDYQGCLQTKQAQLSKECNGTAMRLFLSNNRFVVVGASVAASIGLIVLFLGLRRCCKRRSKRNQYTIPQEHDPESDKDGVFVEDHDATIPNDDIELI